MLTEKLMKFDKVFWGVFFLFISTSQASATIIDQGGYITDTDTGLDWLDLSATTGFSYDQVVANVGAGGSFDGWTIASFDIVHALFNNAGGAGNYGGNATSTSNAGNLSLYNNLVGTWGAGAQFSGSSIWAHVLDVTPGGFTSGFAIGCNNAPDLYCQWADNFSYPSDRYSNIGTALYRSSDSTVPVPASLALVGFGLAALGFTRRRPS
jgi:hypothetical protein